MIIHRVRKEVIYLEAYMIKTLNRSTELIINLARKALASHLNNPDAHVSVLYPCPGFSHKATASHRILGPVQSSISHLIDYPSTELASRVPSQALDPL